MEIKNTNMILSPNLISKKNQAEEGKAGEFDAKLMEACQMFESFFIKEILKTADNISYSENTLFEEGEGEKIFKDMLNDEYAQIMSKGRGIGISQVLYNHLKKD